MPDCNRCRGQGRIGPDTWCPVCKGIGTQEQPTGFLGAVRELLQEPISEETAKLLYDTNEALYADVLRLNKELATARASALEEAAKVCEEQGGMDSAMADTCAAAIRALAGRGG